VHFVMQGQRYEHDFLVVPGLMDDLLFGRDFLLKWNMMVYVGGARCNPARISSSSLLYIGPKATMATETLEHEVSSGDIADCASDLFQSLPVRLQPLLPTFPTYHTSGAMLLPPPAVIWFSWKFIAMRAIIKHSRYRLCSRSSSGQVCSMIFVNGYARVLRVL
jgi:hypothetical protein